MAALTPQAAVVAGIADPTFAAASSGGDTMANTTKKTVLLLKNTHGSAARSITVVAQTTTRPANGAFPVQTVGNIVITVAAGKVAIAGPFPAAYNDASHRLVLTYSDSGADIGVAGYEVTI